MGKRSEVVFGNRMSSQVVKKAENSKERFVKRFGDDSDVDYPLAVVKNPYIGDTLGVSNIVTTAESVMMRMPVNVRRLTGTKES